MRVRSSHVRRFLASLSAHLWSMVYRPEDVGRPAHRDRGEPAVSCPQPARAAADPDPPRGPRGQPRRPAGVQRAVGHKPGPAEGLARATPAGGHRARTPDAASAAPTTHHIPHHLGWVVLPPSDTDPVAVYLMPLPDGDPVALDGPAAASWVRSAWSRRSGFTGRLTWPAPSRRASAAGYPHHRRTTVGLRQAMVAVRAPAESGAVGAVRAGLLDRRERVRRLMAAAPPNSMSSDVADPFYRGPRRRGRAPTDRPTARLAFALPRRPGPAHPRRAGRGTGPTASALAEEPPGPAK